RQLPDDHAADPRRAPRDGRHRRRDLLEQRVWRPQQFRGRPVGACRRFDRPHPALRLSPRRMPPPDPPLPPRRAAARPLGIVFAAPHLSLVEMAAVADALAGREVHAGTTLLVATSPEIKHAADRMGLTGRIEAAGAIVAAGICFYQSYAGEMAEANGWKRLVT